MQLRFATAVTAGLLTAGLALASPGSAAAGSAPPAPTLATRATSVTTTTLTSAADLAAAQKSINAIAAKAGAKPRHATTKTVSTLTSTPTAMPPSLTAKTTLAATAAKAAWGTIFCKRLELTYSLYDPFQYGTFKVANVYCGDGKNIAFWTDPEAVGTLTAWGQDEGWQQGQQWGVGVDNHGWFIAEHAIEQLSWCPPRFFCLQTEDVHLIANGNFNFTTSSAAWIQ